MAGLTQKHNRWDATVRIPKHLRSHYEDREFLYRRLQAKDRRSAKAEADAWEAGLRLEWLALEGEPLPEAAFRDIYQRVRKDAAQGAYQVHADGAFAESPELEGISYEIDKIEEAVGPGGEPDRAQRARLLALQDARRDIMGEKPKQRPELEPAFSEVAKAYMKWWKAQPGLKESNTEKQKQATFRLFAGYSRSGHVAS